MSKFNHTNELKVGWLNLEANSIIAFLACIIFLFLIGKVFVLPLKKVLKLVINSGLGGLLIYLINLFGANFSFHIGLNIGTSIFIGILGLPRSFFTNHIKTYDVVVKTKIL